MHADRLGDVAQDQRPQRLDAATEKGVLLADDFRRDLEDRGRSLVQRFDEPIGRVQPLGQIVLFGLAAGRLADPRAIPVVDQNARQGLGIELDDPAAFRLGAHQDIGHDRLGEWRVEGQPGPRIERFDLGDHLRHVGGVDAAHPDQRRDVAGGEQRQVVEQSLHCGIEPVAVAQLQCEALRQIAGEDAGRVELLEPGENRFDPRDVALEQLRRTVEPGAQVAGLVDQIEKVQGDHADRLDR